MPCGTEGAVGVAMKFDHLTINGEPVRVAAVIDVVSPFTLGWTEAEARA